MTFDVFDDKESLLLQLKKSIEELNKNVRSLNAELNHIEQCYLVDIVGRLVNEQFYCTDFKDLPWCSFFDYFVGCFNHWKQN